MTVSTQGGSGNGSGSSYAAGARARREKLQRQGRNGPNYKKKSKEYNDKNKKPPERCVVCGAKSGDGGKTLAVDHNKACTVIIIMGENRGWSDAQIQQHMDDPQNFSPLCHGAGGCNNKKGGKTWKQFREKHPNLVSEKMAEDMTKKSAEFTKKILT